MRKYPNADKIVHSVMTKRGPNLSLSPPRAIPVKPDIITQIEKLMRTLNELNRSLGFPDPYPFEHSSPVLEKLKFIHQIVIAS